jgi:TATA-box binding protein (TBP) (component of TFIID and TFIIIB)
MSDQEMAFAKSFVQQHLKSPPQPYLSVDYSPLVVQNVVAGVQFGKAAGKNMYRELQWMARIDFTGDVIRWVWQVPGEIGPRRARCSLVFKTGARQCSGAPSVKAALVSLHVIRFIEEELGYRCEFRDFHIDNIVASGKLKDGINVAELEHEDSTGISWRPDKFPGAIFYLREEGAVTLIFDANPVIAVGLQNVEQIERVNRHMHELLSRFAAQENSGRSRTATQRCISKQVASKNPVVEAHKFLKMLNESGPHVTLEDIRKVLAASTAEAPPVPKKPAAKKAAATKRSAVDAEMAPEPTAKRQTETESK